jgi:hypothetical protein
VGDLYVFAVLFGPLNCSIAHRVRRAVREAFRSRRPDGLQALLRFQHISE